MGIEYERKFRADPAQQQELLKALDLPTREIVMETTYYDTPAGDLSRRHITLRRRMENKSSVCTAKFPAPGGARGEWECDCDRIEDAVEKLCKLGAPSELASSSMSISALIVNLSSSGRREHTPLLSCSGSIGSTRPGKYTLVPRRYASRSSALPCGT